MFDLRGMYEIRHRILRIGLPALVSRGTMAVWGILSIFIIEGGFVKNYVMVALIGIPDPAFVYLVARTGKKFVIFSITRKHLCNLKITRLNG